MSSKIKIGADASAAAGPVGRNTSAETDVVMKAEILSYSRAKGLFAESHWRVPPCVPMTAQQGSLREGDQRQRIVREGKVPVPAAAKRLLAILTKASPKHAISKSK